MIKTPFSPTAKADVFRGVTVRLSRSQYKILDKICTKMKVTKQAFVLQALFYAIDNMEKKDG